MLLFREFLYELEMNCCSGSGIRLNRSHVYLLHRALDCQIWDGAHMEVEVNT